VNSIKTVPTKEQCAAATDCYARLPSSRAPDGAHIAIIAQCIAEREAWAINTATEIMTLKVAVPVLKERDALLERVAQLEKENLELQTQLGRAACSFALGDRVRYKEHTGVIERFYESDIILHGIKLKGMTRIRRHPDNPFAKLAPHWWCDLDSLTHDDQPVGGTPFDEDLENK
jgi:hypothetical protein